MHGSLPQERQLRIQTELQFPAQRGCQCRTEVKTAESVALAGVRRAVAEECRAGGGNQKMRRCVLRLQRGIAHDAGMAESGGTLQEQLQKSGCEKIVVAQDIDPLAQCTGAFRTEPPARRCNCLQETAADFRRIAYRLQCGQGKTFRNGGHFLIVHRSGRNGAHGIQQAVRRRQAGGDKGILRGVFALRAADLRFVRSKSVAVVEFPEIQIVRAAAAQTRFQHMRRGAVYKTGGKRRQQHAVQRIRIGRAENVGNIQTALLGLSAYPAHEGRFPAAGAALDDVKLFQLFKERIIV